MAIGKSSIRADLLSLKRRAKALRKGMHLVKARIGPETYRQNLREYEISLLDSVVVLDGLASEKEFA